MLFISKKEKEAIQKYKMYIEGAIDFDVFWKEYISNEYLMKYVCKYDHRKKQCCIDNIYFSINPEDKEHPDFRTKSILQSSICYYLTHKKIEYKIAVKEYYLYEKWNDYIPSFVPYDDSIYYLLENLENGKRHSKKYYRDYFSKIYQYEKYPPRWMHRSEWPIEEDGTPMKFLYQTGFPNNHDYIEYYFKTKDGKRVKIEQYD